MTGFKFACGSLAVVAAACTSAPEPADSPALTGSTPSPVTTVGGNDLGIERRIPPGVRVQSTAEKLAAAPARFITTGFDGTAEIHINYIDDGAYDYSSCVISPIVDDLMAGYKLILKYLNDQSNGQPNLDDIASDGS